MGVGLHGQPAETARRLLGKYPNSSYADYFRYGLGRAAIKRELDRIDGPNDEAIRYFEAIDVKTFPFGPEVLLYLHEIYTVRKEPGKAKKAEDFLNTYYWESVERVLHLALTEKWEKVQELRKAPAGPPEPWEPVRPDEWDSLWFWLAVLVVAMALVYHLFRGTWW